MAAGAVCRILALLHLGCELYARMHIGQFLLYCTMRRRLPRDGSWTVYAQCPRSALTAMRLRRHQSQAVVMVVHFNRSQGQEMSDRGLIRRGGAIDREARRIERQTLLGADRVVYPSGFMQLFLTSSIPGLGARPHRVIPNFVPPAVAAAEGPGGDIITIGTVGPRRPAGCSAIGRGSPEAWKGIHVNNRRKRRAGRKSQRTRI